LYDKDWKKVTEYVGTRISAQVRSHAQKVLSDYSIASRQPRSDHFNPDSKDGQSEHNDRSRENPDSVSSCLNEMPSTGGALNVIDNKANHPNKNNFAEPTKNL